MSSLTGSFFFFFFFFFCEKKELRGIHDTTLFALALFTKKCSKKIFQKKKHSFLYETKKNAKRVQTMYSSGDKLLRATLHFYFT